ncbi:hypothetical protein OAI36_01785 [Alphaproteobacteria bacterium]|nr:hypothetical protein [Alphaproteobacteria bacterium]
MQKFKDRTESLKILMVTGGTFGIFILVMFFVIFYRIERNLNTISELNINMLENMKKQFILTSIKFGMNHITNKVLQIDTPYFRNRLLNVLC